MSNVQSLFLPNLWIKCVHNGEICLGRTYLQESTSNNINLLQRVSLVTENGHTKHVPFSEITHAAVLKIYTAFDFEKENTIKKTYNSQKTRPFELVKTLAKHQLKTIMS